MSSNLPEPASEPEVTAGVLAEGAAEPSAFDAAEEPSGLLDVPPGVGLLPRVGVELLGTFALVLVILGVTLYMPWFGVDPFGIAVAGGLTLAGLIAAFGHISGGHFNPAVTLGAAMAGRIALLDTVLYWLAQVIGGILAAAVLIATVPVSLPGLMGLSGPRAFMSSAANGWGSASQSSPFAQAEAYFDWRAAMVFEVVSVVILVAVVLGVAARRAPRAAAPFAVGITYAMLLLLSLPVTGGALNPARATAAALFADGALEQLWLFWLAPFAAAAVVGLAYFAFTPLPPPTEEPVQVTDEPEPDFTETS